MLSAPPIFGPGLASSDFFDPRCCLSLLWYEARVTFPATLVPEGAVSFIFRSGPGAVSALTWGPLTLQTPNASLPTSWALFAPGTLLYTSPHFFPHNPSLSLLPPTWVGLPSQTCNLPRTLVPLLTFRVSHFIPLPPA